MERPLRRRHGRVNTLLLRRPRASFSAFRQVRRRLPGRSGSGRHRPASDQVRSGSGGDSGGTARSGRIACPSACDSPDRAPMPAGNIRGKCGLSGPTGCPFAGNPGSGGTSARMWAAPQLAWSCPSARGSVRRRSQGDRSRRLHQGWEIEEEPWLGQFARQSPRTLSGRSSRTSSRNTTRGRM